MARPSGAVAAAEERRSAEDAAGGRVCCGCKDWVPREKFSRGAWERTSGSQRCRKCKSKQNRRGKLQHFYGLTQEAYDALLVGQGGVCALCRRLPDLPTDRTPLVVDHDHQTGAVRGLLCDSCNSALGKLGDNEEGLMRALTYVRGS